MSAVGIVILAAGASTRMGSPKQLLRFNDQSLLRRAAETALASDCRPIIVVLGAHAGLLLPEVENLPVRCVVNSDWMQGMGSSITTGVQVLLQETIPDIPETHGVIFMLCDQPYVSPQLLDQLVAVSRDTNAPVVACDYSETLGVPAYFDRSLFPELMGLQGDEGARKVIQRHRSEAASVSFPEGILDIDTPEDFQILF